MALFQNDDSSESMAATTTTETPDVPPLTDLLERPLQRSTPRSAEIPAAPGSQPREMRVDGKRIVIEADQELELRCGEAILLLRRNGEIVIRGNYITSQATATQRIRGGSVHVN